MAFEGLSDKLQNVFKKLKGKGRLTEEDVKLAMKEVKLALLEADVNFKVVKQFIQAVTERAVGTDVLNSLTPGQTVIKIVNEELTALMGQEVSEVKLLSGNEITVIMFCGLQGAGKTTAISKYANSLKQKGKKPLLVACDIYRPAAIDQLKVNASKIDVPVFEMGTGHKPCDISKAAYEHAKKNGYNILLIDTAGRLHVDEEMMDELIEIKKVLDVTDTILTIDSMTGQDAVNVAVSFEEKIGIDGVILTKLDGDTRGGAALSVKAMTGKPIFFISTGEKITELEPFYPDRMANRILGMGDILTLIEKAQSEFDEDKAKQLEKKLKKAEFDYNDLLDQMEQLQKMGGINSVLGMIPGMGSKMKDVEIDEDIFKSTKAIISSMTKEERENPAIMNISRKRRIAAGSGVDIVDVNRLCKQIESQKKVMKQLSGMMNQKGRKKGGFPGGGMGGFGGFPF